jgi:enoyl-CoA hydratase/carnithine racemase
VENGIVLSLTLNRPRSRNALDTNLIRLLIGALEEADRDDAVRAVVLSANGTVFCAGGDTKEFRGSLQARDLMVARAGHLARLLVTLPRLSVPVVTAFSGGAIGAGAALVLGADMAIATEESFLSFPEFGDSVVPAVVMPNLVQMAGRKIAFELLTQGRRLTATDALAAGMINRVTTSQCLHGDALEIAQRWSATDRSVVADTKALFGRVSELPLAEALKVGLSVTETTWQPRD